MDVKTLSGILGHTRAAFTLDTYTHTTGDMQKRAAEIVDEFLTDIFGEKLKTLKDALAPPAPPRIKADMPFGDWMEHWYETYSRPAARPGTRRIYEGYLRLYIRPGLGHIPLNRLTAKEM